MKKLLTTLVVAALAFGATFAFTACSDIEENLGEAYKLRATIKDDEEFSVVFDVSNPIEQDEDWKDIYCALTHVYLNITVPDQGRWEDTSIRLNRSSSTFFIGISSSYQFTTSLASILPQDAKAGSSVWIDPFQKNLEELSFSSRRVSAYRYYKLVALSNDLVINEIVFVGERLTSNNADGVGTGEIYILPVRIEAPSQAEKMIDAQTEIKIENFA